MSKLFIQDIDQDLYDRLEQAAEQEGVSIEQEALLLLDSHLPHHLTTKELALLSLKRIREETAHLQKTDSIALLREDRDR